MAEPRPAPFPGPPVQPVQGPLVRLSILVRIGRAIASNLELEPLLETIHAELSRLFDTLNFFIVVWPVDSPEFTFALHYEQGVRQAAMRRGVDQGLTGCILRTGKSLFFSTVQEKQAFLEREGIRSGGRPSRSWMGVPLVTRDRVVGAMVIQDYEQEGAYTPSDLDLFSAIAAPLAVAVQNAQLYEAAQRRAREMETLARIGRDLTSTLDADQVLRRITDSVRELLTHDSVAIFYRSEREEDFRAIATTGRIAGPLQSLVVRPGTGILGSIAVSGAAEIVSDTSLDARAIHIPGTEHSRQGEKLMAAPWSPSGASSASSPPGGDPRRSLSRPPSSPSWKASPCRPAWRSGTPSSSGRPRLPSPRRRRPAGPRAPSWPT